MEVIWPGIFARGVKAFSDAQAKAACSSKTYCLVLAAWRANDKHGREDTDDKDE